MRSPSVDEDDSNSKDISINRMYLNSHRTSVFSALTLLTACQEGYLACKVYYSISL